MDDRMDVMRMMLTGSDDKTLGACNSAVNLESISHSCHPILVAFEWKLTEETINFCLGCLQGG